MAFSKIYKLLVNEGKEKSVTGMLNTSAWEKQKSIPRGQVEAAINNKEIGRREGIGNLQ